MSDQLPPSYSAVQISEYQAAVLVGHLATDGFLYRGTINRMKMLVIPVEPYYFLWVKGKDGAQYYEYVPWTEASYRWHFMTRPPKLQQMDNIRAVLVGEAGEAMDRLLKAVERQRKPRAKP